MPSVLPLVTFLFLAAQPRPESSMPREVSSPEGLSFTAPAGFSHEVEKGKATPVHVLKGSSASIRVVVAATALGGGNCEGTAFTRRFTTAHGLKCCTVERQVQSGSTGLAIVLAGNARVIIAASGRDGIELARTVANSVRVSPALASGKTVPTFQRPKDFVGCYSSGSSSGSVSSAFQLCLHDDSTFEMRSMINARGETHGMYGGDTSTSAYGDDDDRGTWFAVPAADKGKGRWYLTLGYRSGRAATWLVRFYKGNLVKGEDDLWTRTGR